MIRRLWLRLIQRVCWRWSCEEERWAIEDQIGEAGVRLGSVGLDLPLAAIYSAAALD